MIPRFKLLLPLAVLGLLAAGAVPKALAQSGTQLQGFFPIGLAHAQSKPYNFTGRIFSFNDVTAEIASGTLIRRHTVLTAGHVVFDPTLGFLTNGSFSRGLYGNYVLSNQQISAVAALGGYQTDVIENGEASIEADARDLGYVLVSDPPVDEDWGVFLADPTQLTNDAGRFILGYPGVTFDGRTMAYVVPQSPYVEIGPGHTGAFNNDLYIAEPGFSGGPVYAVVNGTQTVVAELTTGNGDTTAEFNIETVRAIDKEAGKFLQDAEYTAGLIRRVKLTGPTLASRGTAYTYTASIKFKEPNPDDSKATTDRYSELKLRSDALGTTTKPVVSITKLSNTQFKVIFSSDLRAGSTVNLRIEYDKGKIAPKSGLAVRLQ